MCLSNGFYTILGVIIGFSLTFLADYCKSKKINENIKSLIMMELSNNKIILERYIQNIEFDNNDLEIVCPNFSLKNWNTLLSDIPKAFKNNEVEQLFKFYNKLEQLIDSDLWIKPIFYGEPKDLYGQMVIIEKPITNNNIKLINDSKMIIHDKIKELLDILNEFDID